MIKHLNVIVRFLVILWTIVVILVLSLLFYNQSKNVVLEKTYDTNIALLKEQENISKNQDKMAFHITEQIFSDFNVAYLLHGKTYDPIQLQMALIQLKGYRLSIPYIDSIYIYNKDKKSITISSDYNGEYDLPIGDKTKPFFDHEIEKIILNSNDTYNHFQPILRIMDVTIRNKPESLYIQSYIRTVSYQGSPMESAVVVNFNENWFNVSSIDVESHLIVVNKNGIVLTNEQPYPLGTDISEQSFYQEIINTPSLEGYFLSDIDNSSYAVTYLEPDKNGKRYIGLTPYSKITQPLTKTLNNTLVITTIVLIICLFIAFIILHLFSKPINRIKVQVKEMEKENRKAQIVEKTRILRQLLFGKISNKNKEQLQKYSELLDINLRLEKYYQVILIKIDDYNDFSDRYTLDNQNLIIFGILNILKELIETKFSVEVVKTGEENTLVLLLEVGNDLSIQLTKTNWKKFFTPMGEKIFELLKVSISFIVGLNSVLLLDIPIVYRLTKEVEFHRMFYAKKSILFAENITKYNTTDYVYPEIKNKSLISAITSGEAEEAKEVLYEILEDARQYPYSVIIFAVAHLTLTFNNLLNEMQRASFLTITEETNQLILKASQLNDKTIDNFFGIIDLIIISIEDKRNYRHIEILEKINRMIDENYSDKTFCLDWIADEVGMSSDYIGRIYRRYSLHSVSEQIIQVRMENAKQMLIKQPKLTIYQVAEKTGFSSNSYFSRIFRKINGMSPNEYRKYISKGEDS